MALAQGALGVTHETLRDSFGVWQRGGKADYYRAQT
jgi:hypothetical protein